MLATTRTPIGRPRGKMKVLIVDGSAEVRSHARHLDGSGLKVYTARSGAGAMDLIRRAVPDVVVMSGDVDGPPTEGPELCRQLRDDDTTRHVPVVMVTGGDTSLGTAAIDSGCDVVLRQPCSPDLLLTTVQLLLDRPAAWEHGSTDQPPSA